MSHDVLSISHESASHIDRRRLLRLLGVSAIATTLTSDISHIDHPPRVSAYLPTWLSNENYENMQKIIETHAPTIDRMHLAFAHFDTADAVARVPSLAPGLRALIGGASPEMDLSLSLGGGEADERVWYAAWTNRSRYGKSVDDSRRVLEDLFQRPVHIDLDCERNIPASTLTELARATHNAVSDRRDFSMAVPADHQLDIFDARPDHLGHIVDAFRVMTYDQYGPWSKEAGPIATGEWILSAMRNWILKVGDPSKLEVGYPTYGYRYPGAQRAGDGFHADDARLNSVLYDDLPKDTIHDDSALMTSEAITEEGWTSCLSPRMIGAIAIELHANYPNLGGSFFWSMNGLTPAHLDAVTK